jgi:sugar phosphate isomerase/epimerase
VASTPEKAAEVAASAGFGYIEVPVTTWKINPEVVTEKDIASIKGMLKKHCVVASSLGMIWPRDYLMVTSSAVEWRRNLNYARKLFAFSEALGIEFLNMGGSARSVPAGVPYYDGVKTLARFWKEASKYAEDLGVVVCIEALVRSDSTNVGTTSKEIMDLVEAVDSPSFQINVQVHQMAYTDLNVADAIRAQGHMIRLVHIADVDGFNPITDPISFVMPGRGKFDFVAIFRAFKDVGYDGEFCIEPRAETFEGKDVIKELREGRELLAAAWRRA